MKIVLPGEIIQSIMAGPSVNLFDSFVIENCLGRAPRVTFQNDEAMISVAVLRFPVHQTLCLSSNGVGWVPANWTKEI